MASPASYTYVARRGDDVDRSLALQSPGGRVVTDLVLASGDATATSASAAFTAADEGTQIATADGSGIDDGTTILSVTSPTEIELDANATGTGTFVASIRALDASGYSSHLAQYRPHEDAPDSDATALTVTATRDAVGVFVVSVAASDTEYGSGTITTDGVWDWQATVSSKVRTLVAGQFTLEKDVSRS